MLRQMVGQLSAIQGSGQCVAAALAFVVIGLYPHDLAAAGDPDLTVQIQQVTANPVLTGAHPITYRVTVRNVEDASASSVPTVVTFPYGWTFETPAASGSDFSCSSPITPIARVPVSVHCTTSQVGANAQKEFTVRAKAPTAIDGNQQVFTITATVDPNNAVDEEDNGNNTGTVTTTVETRADLTASVSGSATRATVGTNITYVMTLKNIGDRAVGSAWGIAYLPQQVDFDQDKSERGAFQSCALTSLGGQHSGQKVLCVGNLLPGAQASANVIVKVPSLVPDGTQMLYSVRADPQDGVTERSELNNSAGAITTVSAPSDLRITGRQSHSCGTFGLGDCTFALHLVVHNAGPGQSGSTILRVTLPPGYVDGSTICPPPQYMAGGGMCVALVAPLQVCSANCSITALAPGAETNELVISARASGNMAGTTLIIPVVVDPNNTVRETNENNNGLTFTFTQ